MAITAVRKQGVARQRRSGREWKRGRKMRVNPQSCTPLLGLYMYMWVVCVKKGGFYVLMM